MAQPLPNPEGHPRRRHHRRRRLVVWDKYWVRRWQRVRPPPWLDRSLLVFVRMGDGWGWAGIALLLYFLLPPDRFRFLAGQALVAACISIPLYWMFKLGFRRSRPYVLFTRISPRVPPLDVYSFPSGHTMNNLAVAASLACHLPWLWPAALALPVCLGMLRVLYGVHFLTDIAAGSVLGLTSAMGACWLYLRFLA